MNSDLTFINELLLANRLSLNVVKTEFILIGSAHKLNNIVAQPDLNINHVKIKQVHKATVLGVELDDKLSWNKHIDKVAKKVTSGIGANRKIPGIGANRTMYKVLNNLAPSSLAELLEHERNITKYDFRGSSTSLQLPQPKTEKLKKSFSYDGAKLWNSLPPDMRNSDTLTIFKERIRAHTVQ